MIWHVIAANWWNFQHRARDNAKLTIDVLWFLGFRCVNYFKGKSSLTCRALEYGTDYLHNLMIENYKFFLLVRKFPHLTETHFTYLFFFFFAIWGAGDASFLHENTLYLPKLMKKPTWFDIFPKNPLGVLTKKKNLEN